MTINSKITLLSTFVFGLLLAGFAVLIYRGLREAEIAKLDARLEVHAGKIETEFEEEADERAIPVAENFLSVKTDGLPEVRMRIIDREGKIFCQDSLLATSSTQPLHDVLTGVSQKSFLRLGNDDFRCLWAPIEFEGKTYYAQQIAAPMTEVEANLHYLQLLFMITIPLALLITAFAASLITRLAFRPMSGMVETARQISASNLHTRLILPDAHDEVRALGDALNKMIERIDSSFKSQKQFIADASHEIRTPLSIINSELEFVERQVTDPAIHDSIQASLAEIDRLARMAEGMLLLARLDSLQDVLRLKLTRLDELLVECVQLMRALAAKKHIEINLFIEEAVEISADTEKLKSVMLNLLDNSIRYSKPNGTVDAKLMLKQSLPRRALVILEDRGYGIAAPDIQNIFKRFYRGETARAETSGSGLGLAIAEQIIALHNGSISVQSEEGKGSVFTIELPCS
jgi:signal transduction histidine kinase